MCKLDAIWVLTSLVCYLCLVSITTVSRTRILSLVWLSCGRFNGSAYSHVVTFRFWHCLINFKARGLRLWKLRCRRITTQGFDFSTPSASAHGEPFHLGILWFNLGLNALIMKNPLFIPYHALFLWPKGTVKWYTGLYRGLSPRCYVLDWSSLLVLGLVQIPFST